MKLSSLPRHVTTFTDRLCYSHSDRIRLASNLSPPHQRISSVTEKGDSIGSHRHPRLLPSLILSVLRYASNVCAASLSLFFFSPLSHARQFFFVRGAHEASPKIVLRYFSFLAARTLKKTNSMGGWQCSL